MANSLTFTTPAGENVTFTLTAATAGQDPAFMATFTTASGGALYLKVFETGDSENPITDYDSMEQGKLYDIEAYSDAGFTTPADITSWSGTNVEFVGITFQADRRPMLVSGFATSTSTDGPATNNAPGGVSDGEAWGVPQTQYRKTPAAGNDMTDSQTNGRLLWTENKIYPAIDAGFDRVGIWNPAGYINQNNGSGGYAPEYPANPYSSLSQSTAPWVGNFSTGTTTSPFTPNGIDGTIGDSEAAWTTAITAIKDRIAARVGPAPGPPKIQSYSGYRPNYTNNDMATYDRTFLGTSSPSDIDGWDPDAGGNNPSYNPQPGFDYVDANNPGISSSNEKFEGWWDVEAAGLYSMGFNEIGLDTGARLWFNSEGMVREGTGQNAIAARPGSARLTNVFTGLGFSPMVESIPMAGFNATTEMYKGDNAGIYTTSACLGLFGTVIGYSGLDSNGNALNIQKNLTVFNADASDNATSATIGNPAVTGSADQFGSDTEVHCTVRWGNQTEVQPFMDINWLTLKQVLYDMHKAGLIVGAGGDPVGSMTDGEGTVVTAAEFHQYVIDLSTGAIASRPEPAPEVPYFDIDFTSMATASGVIDNSTTTDFGVSGGRVFENYGVQDTSGPTWALQSSSSSNGWYLDTHISKSVIGDATWQDSFVTDLGTPPSGGWVMEGKAARGAQSSLGAVFGFIINGGDRADGDYTVIGIAPKAGTNTSAITMYTNNSESNQTFDMFPGDLAANPEAHMFLRLTYDGVDYTLEGWVGDDDTGTQFCDQSFDGSLVTDHGNNFGWFAPSGLVNGRGISLFSFKMAPPGVADDWDTYAIAETSSIVSNGSTWVTGVTMTPTGQLFDISQLRVTSAVQVRDLSGTVTAAYETDVPYIAVWNATTGVWTTHAWQTDSGQIQQYTLGGTVPTAGDTLVVVGLSQDPGDISGWSNYS